MVGQSVRIRYDIFQDEKMLTYSGPTLGPPDGSTDHADCLASHPGVPGSNPAVPLRGFQRNIIVSPFSM